MVLGQVITYATYLAETGLIDYSMLEFRPSEVAAAAVHVSLEAFHAADSYPVALCKHAGVTVLI